MKLKDSNEYLSESGLIRVSEDTLYPYEHPIIQENKMARWGFQEIITPNY